MSLAKVLANKATVKIGSKTFTIDRNIGWDAYAKADDVYTHFLYRNRFFLPSTEQIHSLVVKRGLLEEDWKDYLKRCKFQIVLYQEELYNDRYHPNKRELVKNKIKSLKKSINDIFSILVEHSRFSIEELAQKEKDKSIISSGLNARVSPRVLELIYESALLNRINDDKIREIARSQDWRNYWASKKGGSFKYYPLTFEQRRLMEYSLLYDSIFKAHERPEAFVIEDDDMLDGWISLQNKKTKDSPQTERKNSAEKHSNVFKIVKNKAQAQEIINSNPVDVINKQISKIKRIKNA